MGYRPVPQFDGAQLLSATAINELTRLTSDLYSRATIASVPQPLLSATHDATKAGSDYILVTDRLAVHRHFAGVTEYIYYDILFEASSTASRCYLYAINCRPDTAEPILTLEPSASRQRALVGVPTGLGHPADDAHYQVSVYIKRDTDDTCTATVYALQALVYPTGYTTMNDATALTDATTAEAIPDDLQTCADNAGALDTVACADIPMFRSEQHETVYGTPSATFGPWVFNYFDAGRLYYKLAIWVNEHSRRTFSLQFKINSVNVGSALSWTENSSGIMTGSDLEGFIALGAYGAQTRLRVEAVFTQTGGGDEVNATIRMDYLGLRPGTTFPAGWIPMAGVAHLDTVHLDSPPLTFGYGLRDVWTNLLYLAGDDGSGYGKDGYDIGGDGNYPIGHALVGYRSPLVQTSVTPGAAPITPRYGIVTLPITSADGRVTYHPYQQGTFLRTRDQLYYRGKGLSLVFNDAGGRETEQSLDDYEDTDGNQYKVLNLTGVKGLRYGMLYYLRASLEDDPGDCLDYAYERV